MQEYSKTRARIFIVMGLFLISAGIILNEWLLSVLFSADGVIATTHRIIIWIFDVASISAGFMLIKFHRFMTKEKLCIITGVLLILTSIFFIGKLLPMMMNGLSDQNRLFLRVVEAYFIIIGAMAIFYRKSVDLAIILLFGVSSLLCFALFLGFDYYRFYSKIIEYRSIVSKRGDENPQHHMYVSDDKLGWKLIANNRVRHNGGKEFDVTYEIDEKGFKKINNSEGKPDFSMYFFGDSFTFGDGVKNEDNFANIIKEKYLTKEINVYNAGVNGYGTVQMFQRFLNLKDDIRPGDLIIFTPIADDIKRNLTDFKLPYFIKFTNLLEVEHFPFFHNGVMTYPKMEDNIYNKIKLCAIGARYTGYFFRFIRNKFIPDTTKESEEMIKIIERETKLRGGKFVLFFLPETGERLYETYTVDISGFHYFDIMHFFPSEEKELKELRISKTNGHYNKRGNEIAAKAIIETLVSNGIVDKKYIR